jgi:hypothetical protein
MAAECAGQLKTKVGSYGELDLVLQGKYPRVDQVRHSYTVPFPTVEGAKEKG